MAFLHYTSTRFYRSTEGVGTQTELSSYLHAASFASLNNEIKNIFGYMKKRFCEDSFVLSPKCSSAGEVRVSHSL
jgi:hypothetical protein